MGSSKDFTARLKVAWFILGQKVDMQVKCCEYCGSTKIKRISGRSHGGTAGVSNVVMVYEGKYACCNCGAAAIATEHWIKPE